MFYHLLYPLHEIFSPFNVFRYITFRTVYATLTALILALIIGSKLIEFLKNYNIGQNIRDDVPKRHLQKQGTPTMGGILILFSALISTFLWADLTNKYIWICFFSIISMGILGFFDDYIKLFKRNPIGIRARYKFLFQFGIAFILAILILKFLKTQDVTKITFPFFKNIKLNLGLFYIIFAIIVIVGSANGVNLTDGLDGLAIGPFITAIISYMIIAYVSGHVKFASYLKIIYVPGAGELSILCGALVGASLGFLWYNSYPAQVFMGDIGSLPLGAVLGTIAILTKHEILLIVIGGIFVVETISVILQVISFKLTKRRIFQMAPLHHHFELKGWAEPKIIVRFWIISIILALFSLSTLKLR